MQNRESHSHKSVRATESEVDAIRLLKSQHREVEALFSQIEKAGDRAAKKKEKLFAEIARKLTDHTKIEESFFYPAAKEVDEDLVFEAFEEHDNVKAMIRKLKKTSGDDETFDAKIKTLKELVQHHVKEEEQDLFPKCEKALGTETLLELGEQMQEKFEQLERAH